MQDAKNKRLVFPLDEVREAYQRGEFTLQVLADRVGRNVGTVSRALSGKNDPGEKGARAYYEALLAIRAERAAADCSRGTEEGALDRFLEKLEAERPAAKEEE